MSVTHPFMRLAALAPLALALAACAGFPAGGRMPTEADFATIQPGMTSAQILARFGRPTWVFGVRQENLAIWNYRYNRNDCFIYQVSIRPEGTVKDASPGWDPACDSRSRD